MATKRRKGNARSNSEEKEKVEKALKKGVKGRR